jgi:EAL domain-containing protein (putative c-di-GMP-specific phosphodiesterase class I)
VAEAIGLTPALTAWVLDAALRQGAIWQLEGTPRPIAVNVPPSALYDRRLVEEVRTGLAAHGVPASGLVVEITETTMMIDPERATRVLHELHALGVAVAVDDFGVGHSSLAYLRDLPIEQVKIDRSFIFDYERGEPIVRAVVDLGRSIGLQVVAEGVEDEATAIALRDMGCHVLQGFLFARPVPPEDLRPASAWTPDPYPRRQPLAA